MHHSCASSGLDGKHQETDHFVRPHNAESTKISILSRGLDSLLLTNAFHSIQLATSLRVLLNRNSQRVDWSLPITP